MLHAGETTGVLGDPRRRDGEQRVTLGDYLEFSPEPALPVSS